MQTCIYVGLGGFIGSVLRYLLGLVPLSGDYPVITMLINFLGCVAIGIVSELFKDGFLSQNCNFFLKTGVCGGFTTFSTFSLETFSLIKTHKITAAITYSALSVIVCLLGVYLGMMAAGLIKSKCR